MKGEAGRGWLVWLQGLLLAVIAGGLVGLRFGLFPWRAVLLSLALACLGMAIVGFLSLLLLYLDLKRGRQQRLKSSLLAVALSALPVAAVLVMGVRGSDLPPIHDISTDMENPPALLAARQLRRPGDNPLGYGGAEVARQQAAAYGEVQPLFSVLPQATVYHSCRELVREFGWQLVSEDAAQGRLEAVATTPLLGFKDDVVILVQATGQGSRVDLRSASRVGVSDFGANAARIAAFLNRLQELEP
ncbi:DUF1499 domain-containing protein [Desulfogranum mediterraneum]|uniref:DUF1499 domain-containing protein n=1 Tax=Desulfogranum mediterraneum TaxID=160661 RepID=UPI0004063D95|nr:DUF1499 domain-containing protein [Desulfogranum mediterraneum]